MTYSFEGIDSFSKNFLPLHEAKTMFKAGDVTERGLNFAVTRYLQSGDTAHLVHSARVRLDVRRENGCYLVLVEGPKVKDVCNVDSELSGYLILYPKIVGHFRPLH